MATLIAGKLTAFKHDTPVALAEGCLEQVSVEQTTDSTRRPDFPGEENNEISFAERAISEVVTSVLALRRQVPNATVFFNGFGFCSVCEAVCATMLELYIPGFAIKYGATYQIDLGQGRTGDFFINGIVCEFHGVRLAPERPNLGFRNRGQARNFQRRLRRYGKGSERGAQLVNDTRCALMADYYARRRQAMDESEDFRDAELVVVTSADEFYEQVILRFNPRFAPVRHDFIDSFFSLAKMIGKQNIEMQREQRRRAA